MFVQNLQFSSIFYQKETCSIRSFFLHCPLTASEQTSLMTTLGHCHKPLEPKQFYIVPDIIVEGEVPSKIHHCQCF